MCVRRAFRENSQTFLINKTMQAAERINSRVYTIEQSTTIDNPYLNVDDPNSPTNFQQKNEETGPQNKYKVNDVPNPRKLVFQQPNYSNNSDYFETRFSPSTTQKKQHKRKKRCCGKRKKSRRRNRDDDACDFICCCCCITENNNTSDNNDSCCDDGCCCCCCCGDDCCDDGCCSDGCCSDCGDCDFD